MNPCYEFTVSPTLPLSLACPAAFLFPETPVNSQAEFPCSVLDDSFLPGGVITVNCSANNTWDALDMSQCTFRNDVQVATIAVVEVLTSPDRPEETLDQVYIALQGKFTPTSVNRFPHFGNLIMPLSRCSLLTTYLVFGAWYYILVYPLYI